MNPFKNTLWLSLGDVIAKTLNFLAIVYLARVLGVVNYGVLEFAITVLTYFTLIADGGLEIWSARETARGGNISHLISNTISIRLVLSILAFAIILIILPFLPSYPYLQPVLLILGGTLILQAINPKWVFYGQEKMRLVAFGLVMAQLVFVLAMVFFIKTPDQLVWVALIWLISELVATIYFIGIYLLVYRGGFIAPQVNEIRKVIKPAITIGLMQALGIMNYNFDSLLLGFMTGMEPVGWYRAGYKPITAAIGVPLTYFTGLIPALTRGFAHSREQFLQVFQRSIRLTVLVALPIGVAGLFLSQPIIQLLYGEAYSQSIRVMQILSWSAVIVLIRATLRHGLLAAGRQDLALRSAIIAVGINVTMNIFMIPRFGLIGAAATTVFSDLVWLALLVNDISRTVEPFAWAGFFVIPVISVFAMGIVFYFSSSLHWPIQLILAGFTYFGFLALLGEKEIRAWVHLARLKIS